MQQMHMTNPINESAYMELRSEYLSATLPTAVVGKVSVMMLSTLTVLDLSNYRIKNFHIMPISSSLLTHQLLLYLLNQ